MPGNDVKISGFKEIEAALYTIESGEAIDRIQRSALRAAGNVIAPALEAATPIKTEPGGLPDGALKAAVRMRTRLPKDGEAPAEIIDFGKHSWIAHIVDHGHINPTAKKGLKHTPAYPFVRDVEEATHAEAVEAYVSTMQAGINKVLEGK